MPKEYNLTLEGETFSSLHKDWEPLNEKFITKLMDNGLEFVSDYAQIFFDAIQASQQPGAGVETPGSQTPPTAGSTSTPATARVLTTRPDDEDTGSAAGGPVSGTGSASSAHSTPLTQPLHPSMLSDPAYEAVWEEIMQNSPMGDMFEQLKDVKNQLLSAHNQKYNDKVVMGVAGAVELKALHKRMMAQILRTINHQIV